MSVSFTAVMTVMKESEGEEQIILGALNATQGGSNFE